MSFTEDQAHDRILERAFTEQADGFNASPVANAAEILDAIVVAARPQAPERWIEAACGPGIVSRVIAPLVESIHGVDITPAMIELARREAVAAGLANTTFVVGDATATRLETSSFDGAVTRFSVHHLPLPARMFSELARVLRPGGRLVVVDHLADEDPEARAWSQELERLRDPSHWASVTAARMRLLADSAGFEFEQERCLPFEFDFDDWLRRGTSDPAAHGLVERGLAERPSGTACFAVDGGRRPRTLTFQIWLGAWRRR